MVSIKKIKIYIKGAIDCGSPTRIFEEEKFIKFPNSINNIDVIFIREDGFTVGCKEEYFDKLLDSLKWSAYTRKPFEQITLLEEKQSLAR